MAMTAAGVSVKAKEGLPEEDQRQPGGGNAAWMGKLGRLDELCGLEHCRRRGEGAVRLRRAGEGAEVRLAVKGAMPTARMLAEPLKMGLDGCDRAAGVG
eukprot:11135534-Heterocapsa_arctica.AAC.1